jgi:hypothetical protein
MKLKMKAATVLDLTHKCGYRGPMTMWCRDVLAKWLDTGRGHKNIVKKAIAHLEMVAAKAA